MPNNASAAKRMRQNIKRRERNRRWRSRLRTVESNFRKSLEQNTDIQKSEALLKEACSLFEKAVNKKIIHKNKAARKCSALQRQLNAKKAPASEESPETSVSE